MNLHDHILGGGACDLEAREDTLEREPHERIYRDPVDDTWSSAASFMDMNHGEGEPDWRGEAHWTMAQMTVAALMRPFTAAFEADLASDARRERDERISAVQWMKDRHADELVMGLVPTLSTEAYALLLTYIQALRDVTDQPGFPREIEWPVLVMDEPGLSDGNTA